jgi:hypothetical protein
MLLWHKVPSFPSVPSLLPTSAFHLPVLRPHALAPRIYNPILSTPPPSRNHANEPTQQLVLPLLPSLPTPRRLP